MSRLIEPIPFSTASPEQAIAFIGSAIAHIAFLVWVAYLALR